MALRDEYLDEVLRLEGRGFFGRATHCPTCGVGVPEYQCLDCLGGQLFCKTCVLDMHARLPLHRLQVGAAWKRMRCDAAERQYQIWSGTYFKRTSLREAGFVLRPSHLKGEQCITAAPAVDLVVLHLNGMHTVAAEFCKCGGSSRRTQLLRLGWWPATPFDPRTCATMAVLRHFHLLNLQGKVTAYDYYRALHLGTDNSGLQTLPVSRCCVDVTI